MTTAAPDKKPLFRLLGIQTTLLIGLALIPALGAAFLHPGRPPATRFEAPAPVITLEAARRLDPPVLWVDARSKREFVKGHVPGAILLNEDDWETGLDAFLDAWAFESNVVIYCSGEECERSQEVAIRLQKEARIDNIYVLAGGWKNWNQARKEPGQP